MTVWIITLNMDKTTRYATKEKTRRAYDKVGSDYDNWYWAKSAKKLRISVREKVLEVLKKELRTTHEKPRILDLCCGTGYLYNDLSKLGDYTGLDFAESMVKHCSVTYPRGKFVLGDAEKMPFLDNSFDTVVCSWSFHHFTNPKKVFREMQRILKPNGLVLIATFKNIRFNPAAKLGDAVSSAYWGFATIRYSEKEMHRLIGERFKSLDIKIFPKGFSLLSTMGIRFLIVSGRK